MSDDRTEVHKLFIKEFSDDINKQVNFTLVDLFRAETADDIHHYVEVLEKLLLYRLQIQKNLDCFTADEEGTDD